MVAGFACFGFAMYQQMNQQPIDASPHAHQRLPDVLVAGLGDLRQNRYSLIKKDSAVLSVSEFSVNGYQTLHRLVPNRAFLRLAPRAKQLAILDVVG